MSSNYPIIKRLGTATPTAADITTDVGSFSNILGSSDLDVQLALDSIDDMSFIDISDTISSYTDGRVLFESATGVTDSANFTYDAAGDILTIGNLQFDLTPTHVHSEGSLHWNDDYKALQMDTEASDVEVVLGQQQVVRVNNQTGSTISRGSVVYINGAQGQRPTIALADADIEIQADSTIGIVLADISDSGNGYVGTSGLARELDTSAFSVGDHVFLSQTPGEITNVKPAPPAHAIFLGVVTVSNATTGTIELNIDIGEDLKDFHDVNLGTLSDGDVVTYNSTSGLWENQQPSGGSTSVVSTETAATVNLGATPQTVLCDATSNNMTVNLPAASGNANLVHIIKKTDSSVNTVTIDGDASETIDGSATLVISTQYVSYTVVCDGSNWHII